DQPWISKCILQLISPPAACVLPAYNNGAPASTAARTRLRAMGMMTSCWVGLREALLRGSLNGATEIRSGPSVYGCCPPCRCSESQEMDAPDGAGDNIGKRRDQGRSLLSWKVRAWMPAVVSPAAKDSVGTGKSAN